MVFHLLTAVLFLLKVMDIIDISWWLVVAPSLVAITVLGVIMFIALLGAAWATKF